MFSIVKGIIKFTIESVPIPAGSWQDVNQMLGPVELVPSKSASNISLMILLLEIFGRYLPRQAAPTKKLFSSSKFGVFFFLNIHLNLIIQLSLTLTRTQVQELGPRE